MVSRPVIGIVSVAAIAAVAFYVIDPSSSADSADQPANAHFRTMDSAQLTAEAARGVYEALAADMRTRYGEADIPHASAYQQWTRFSSAPYRSASHGQRYVSNYGNELAADYPQVLDGVAMPPGAVLAKDAFAATTDGDVYAQSLFLMEKLAPGASPQTGDWRYVMITPAGEVYGDTTGAEPANVTFCHTCHAAQAHTDYLFYIPEAFRAAR
ncbi:MAG: cytochrome P460 family protein [Minwuia sp.]|uniref:cytochrome P460 family protein n=1 Tax=Minwuia sp. TaxID=2493630 RepID=UPI003A8A7412